MKAVLISIHPEWCEKIASGEKTLEVRKNRPKLETPFKCYIYRTKSEGGASLRAAGFRFDGQAGGKQYRHEMTEQDHLDLLEALKQHKGSVILSGYPSEMYDLELRGWSVIQRKSYNQNADPRTEVLWCNFEVPGLFVGME